MPVCPSDPRFQGRSGHPRVRKRRIYEHTSWLVRGFGLVLTGRCEETSPISQTGCRTSLSEPLSSSYSDHQPKFEEFSCRPRPNPGLATPDSCDCLNRMLSDHAFKTKPDHGCS